MDRIKIERIIQNHAQQRDRKRIASPVHVSRYLMPHYAKVAQVASFFPLQNVKNYWKVKYWIDKRRHTITVNAESKTEAELKVLLVFEESNIESVTRQLVIT